MKKARYGRLWAVLIACSILGLAWEFYPLKDAGARLALLQTDTMGFKGVDLPLTPTEQAFFDQVRVVKRMYQNGQVRFLLLVVDGTKNRHCVHDPMYCFRGAGWQVVSQAEVPMAAGRARWVRIQKDGQEQEVIYWFSDGRRRHASPVKYWVQTTLRRLTLGFSGEEPVLVEVQLLGGLVNAARLLDAFVPLQEI